jgi:transcriptional regulator with XRE-family HTH domain
MSILAKNLKTIRKELRCTQSMMSEILKVGFRTYVRYEAGERDAPVSVLVKISKLGNLSLEQLLTVPVKKNGVSPVKTLTKSSVPPEVRMVHFGTGQINLKSPTRQELLTINSSERKLLTIFRKMDAGLQKECLGSIGKSTNKAEKKPKAGAKKSANKKKTGAKKAVRKLTRKKR